MRTLSFRRRSRRTEAGFSLIEVLVSIVVLSFGLLGMVGLQAASLQANRDARLQSTAILLARDIAEAMRGNKAVATNATAPSNPYIGNFLSTGGAALVPTVASYCLNVGLNCASPTATGSAQMTEWLARVSDQLPGARVVICPDSSPYDASGLPTWNCTSTSTDVLVIKIGWTRPSFQRGSSTNSLDRASLPSVILPVTPGSTT